ncbi:MAG TPA: hypothetical protein VH089_12570 [Streptosporangiaceae bacterium]|jgi:hypothetical protein|nr:hypothetical protein [Streptosporangiaceae bacterium]
MKLINYWRRIAIVLTGLGVGLAGLAGLTMMAGAASAATDMFPAADSSGGTASVAPTVVAGGTPGWQIALIAVGAALAAAVIAVLVDRARHSRLRLAGETA